ncbi:hypothetical protein H310_05754 [Aphanomyces invadans]|uniref:Uncharacterized protein n=1 Tax=Aphanomyces invadans TaxID=157072 RepID=A0A024U6Y2_9STRA|nr:hypothetical protein H310_05754 [Aphanomyces invadans]ETW02186.1 hypothetical protein H310_05754 [Aphanomyces invadans]RHY23035.1 hypothetical protein DYB32_009322 [Aphanomyces invadans]|eukprot:XP_008868791.1 hypothetical protein H310_05754 [Aphanomyces invadans]
MAAWYEDSALLRDEVARAIGGYKGQVAERWHVIPVGCKKFSVEDEAMRMLVDDPETPLGLRASAQHGKFDVDDDEVTRCILRLGDMVGHDDPDLLYGMDVFTYIQFDVEDAAGKFFHFDMIMNEGNADANTGFFAIVFNRSSEKEEVAHCMTHDDSETKITWLDESMLQRYAPHDGLLPPTTDKHLPRHSCADATYRDLHHEFFESSMGLCGIALGHDDDMNQLELLTAVAAKLSEKPAFFPTVVPKDLMEKTKAAYLKEVLHGVPNDVWQLTGDYLSSATLYHDRDVSRPFRDVDRWND